MSEPDRASVEPVVAAEPPLDTPAPGSFATVPAEGPFGFKPDRNRPIEPHFDGFGRLTPEQARQVLDVRDGRLGQCLLDLPTETVLFEHAGQGYCDPATGRQWGYRVRRVVRHEPSEIPPPPAQTEAPPVEPAEPPPPMATPEPPVQPVPPRKPVPRRVAREARPAVVAEPSPTQEQPEPDEEWFAPTRSPRAAALADPAERTAVVRVLLLWFVVALLLADCLALLLAGR